MNENKKITQLDVATEIKPEDIIPIVQDGTNKQITKETLFAGVNDSEELNKKFEAKADKATTLKGYGITDAYTKKEVDKALENIDLADYYTKEETDAEIVFSEEDITDRTKVIIDDEEMNTMGSEITNEKSDSKFLAYSANYLKDKLVCVSPIEPENGEEVWIQVGKNLISSFKNNQSFDVGLNDYKDDPYGFSVTDYIDVQAGVTYMFSHQLNFHCGGVHLFDENNNFLETINADKMFDPIVISNPNCKKIVIYTWDPNNNTTVNETWMQLEVGDTVTEYEPYIDKKIYLRNKAGKYDLFVKPQIKVSPDMPTTGEEVWIKKGKNLFDCFAAKPSFISQEGKEYSFNSSVHYGQIEVFHNFVIDKPYAISFEITETSTTSTFSSVLLFYTDGSYSENNIYSGVVGKHSIVVIPTKEVKCMELRFFRLNNNTTPRTGRVKNIQIEQNDKATPYVDYLPNGFLVKNNNGLYEEFHSGGITLYENKIGSNATITLSDNAANYKWLEIAYTAENNYGYLKVINPQGKIIPLEVNVSFGNSNYFKVSKWEILYNQIHLRTANAWAIDPTEVGGLSENTNQIFITKVIGYK